jgi:hypothetical protein
MIPQENYTKIPNVLLDEWLPVLKSSELRVLLYLARQTFGFQSTRAEVGLRLIAERSGIDLVTARRAVDSLTDRGLICHTPGSRLRRTYSIMAPDCVENAHSAKLLQAPDCVQFSHGECMENSPRTVGKLHTRKRNCVKEIEKESSSSADAQTPPAVPRPSAAAPLETGNILSSEDRNRIAQASNAVILDTPLSSSSSLVSEIAQIAAHKGGSTEALLRFMGSRGRRSWKSHGIWKTVIADELAGFLAEESAFAANQVEKAAARVSEPLTPAEELFPELPEFKLIDSTEPPKACASCRNAGNDAGIVYTRFKTPAVTVAYCTCTRGEAVRLRLGEAWADQEQERLRAEAEALKADNDRGYAELAQRFPGARMSATPLKPASNPAKSKKPGWPVAIGDLERIGVEPDRGVGILAEIQSFLVPGNGKQVAA